MQEFLSIIRQQNPPLLLLQQTTITNIKGLLHETQSTNLSNDLLSIGLSYGCNLHLQTFSRRRCLP